MRRRPLVFMLIGTATFFAASCTSQETAAPPTPGASSSSTTSTTSTSTTIVSEPSTTTTEVSATTSTTEAPPSTVAPPSGRPTSRPTEFFAGGDEDGWLFLGRWSGSAWERSISDDGTPLVPAITNGTTVLLHELDLAPIDGTTGAAAPACPSGVNGVNGPIISPNARAPEDPGFGYRSIAFAADWPTAPRPSAVVEASIDRYLTNGQTAFSDSDVDAASGTIEQILVTDVDGDGDSESLVAFEGATFAALLLIDADSGTGLTVARSIAEITTPTTIAATTETTLAAPAPTVGPIERFRTLAVADLNGDGVAEFVVHSWESASSATVTVYTYDGRNVSAVLTASC